MAARGNAAAVAAAAAAAARAGGRIRTGRSSDRLGGRCSVCQSAPSVRSSSAVRCTGKRGGAGTRGGGGEQASGPRAARRTGDRQAGDGPESDRAQRSERADRRSAAADLEGVRSATVGVGGRPSCGEEGGRQVRVVRVALHRPVERTVASVKVRAGEAARFVARYGSRPNKFGRSGDAPQNQLHGKRATGAANSHLAGLLMFS